MVFIEVKKDRRENAANDGLNPPALVVFKGRVLRAQTIPARSVLIFKAFLCDDKNNQVECTWFKRRSFRNFRFDPFAALKKDFKINAEIWIIGRRENRNNFFDNKINVEEYYPVSAPDSRWHAGRITPIYSLTEGLTQKQFRQFMQEALSSPFFRICVRDLNLKGNKYTNQPPRVAFMIALIVCILFSASSNTTDLGPSNTSLVTSSSDSPNFS